MNSALYFGSTQHVRFFPKAHAFKYQLFYFYLDLDEIESIEKKILFLSTKSRNIYRFCETDHLLEENRSLKSSVCFRVKAIHPDFFPEKVFLLTNLRTFGYVFNPVCFYVLQDIDKHTVIVAEVMNTFYEIKTYTSEVVTPSNGEINTRCKFDKGFYISPYSSSSGELEYVFRFLGEKSIFIEVNNFSDQKMTVQATLDLDRKDLSNWNVVKSIVRFPLITLKIWLGIHYQAAILFLKKLRFYKKNEEKEKQRGYTLWKKALKKLNHR